MPSLLAYRAALSDATPLPRLRVYRSEFAGSQQGPVRLNVYRSELVGTSAVIVLPLPAQTVQPLTVVTLTAVLGAGSAIPDSYTWRRISGALVTINGTGATVTLTAPTHIDGAYVVIGVLATKDGTQTPEQQVRIDARPQLNWAATASGWTPVGPMIAL